MCLQFSGELPPPPPLPSWHGGPSGQGGAASGGAPEALQDGAAAGLSAAEKTRVRSGGSTGLGFEVRGGSS